MMLEQQFLTEDFLRYAAECRRMATLASSVTTRSAEVSTRVAKTGFEEWRMQAAGHGTAMLTAD